MKVLVGFATAHGSTERIASEIAGKLAHVGLSVELRPIESVRAFETYDAMVIGSAVHDGRWLPGVARLLQDNARVLRSRLVWLFSVSALGETSSAFGPKLTRALALLRRDSKELASLREAIYPRGHRHFAGVLERGHWGLAGHLLLMAMGGSYGDHRDTEDIALWANSIARTLVAREPLGAKAVART